MNLLLIVIGCIIVGSIFRIYVKKDASNTLLASIFFLPAILFWVADKTPTELAGFGFSAKFEKATTKSLEDLSVRAIDLVELSPSSADPNFKLASQFEQCSEYFVVRPDSIPAHGKPEFYDYVFYSTYAIRSSIACGRFAGLVVLDQDDQYIGSYDREFFAESLSLWAMWDSDNPMTRKEIAKRIEQNTIFAAALRFPDKRIRPGEGYVSAINENATLGEAFVKFQVMHGAFLVVTDVHEKFKGIITKDNVEGALLDALITSTSVASG